jgi:hypothetical protein
MSTLLATTNNFSNTQYYQNENTQSILPTCITRINSLPQHSLICPMNKSACTYRLMLAKCYFKLKAATETNADLTDADLD